MQMHPHVPPCILRQPLPWHRHDGCYEVLPSWSPDIRTAGLSHLSFCNHRLANAWRSFKQVMPNICCSMYIFLTSSVWFSNNNKKKMVFDLQNTIHTAEFKVFFHTRKKCFLQSVLKEILIMNYTNWGEKNTIIGTFNSWYLSQGQSVQATLFMNIKGILLDSPVYYELSWKLTTSQYWSGDYEWMANTDVMFPSFL